VVFINLHLGWLNLHRDWLQAALHCLLNINLLLLLIHFHLRQFCASFSRLLNLHTPHCGLFFRLNIHLRRFLPLLLCLPLTTKLLRQQRNTTSSNRSRHRGKRSCISLLLMNLTKTPLFKLITNPSTLNHRHLHIILHHLPHLNLLPPLTLTAIAKRPLMRNVARVLRRRQVHPAARFPRRFDLSKQRRRLKRCQELW
jgi:hypothetical protein